MRSNMVRALIWVGLGLANGYLFADDILSVVETVFPPGDTMPKHNVVRFDESVA